MIVVGSHGESPIRGALLGSTRAQAAPPGGPAGACGTRRVTVARTPVKIVFAAAPWPLGATGGPHPQFSLAPGPVPLARVPSVSTWEQLAPLPLEIERYDLEGRELAFSEEFVRYTTLITLRGGGEQGVGEDVVYDGLDHVSFQAAGGTLPLAGSWTLGSFAEQPRQLDAFPDPPVRGDVSRRYRNWAFESAALDLALRQAGTLARTSTSAASCGRSTTSSRCGWARSSSGRARDLRADAARAREVPGHCASSSTRPTPGRDALIEELARVRRRRLARPQGPVQGHAGRRRDRPRAVPRS